MKEIFITIDDDEVSVDYVTDGICYGFENIIDAIDFIKTAPETYSLNTHADD